MTASVRRHAEVESDILNLATWLAKDSRDVAFRFLDAVEETVTGLSFFPGKGSPKNLGGRLAQIRSWAVRGFPNHLVLYDIRGSDVYVLAIVHGSREYISLLQSRISQV